jgi:hypothetical protein
VPGAKVNAKNLNTGITREALTTDEGTYVLAELPAGTYTLTVRRTELSAIWVEIYGPGYRNWDFSITKITGISERLSLQLRAEFFNILNHPNFALPAHTIIPGLIDNGTPGNPQIAPNPAAHVNGNLSLGLLPMAPITQTPDVAQTNPGLGGGGPRVIQLGAKFLF